MLFVCENNLYSTHLHISECRPNEEIYRIAKPFDALTERVDGNDVLAVYEKSKMLIEKLRAGEGPAFLECLTYRMRGHVGPNDNIQGTQTDIRSNEEIAEWREKDPVGRMKKILIDDYNVSTEELAEIENKINDEISEAYKFTEESAYPPKTELNNYVFK